MLKMRYVTFLGLILIAGATPRQLHANESSTSPGDFMAQLAERDAIIIELQHSIAELRLAPAAGRV